VDDIPCRAITRCRVADVPFPLRQAAVLADRAAETLLSLDPGGDVAGVGRVGRPAGFLPPSWLVEICELADVVDLKARERSRLSLNPPREW
jgi:hypothetical protein